LQLFSPGGKRCDELGGSADSGGSAGFGGRAPRNLLQLFSPGGKKRDDLGGSAGLGGHPSRSLLQVFPPGGKKCDELVGADGPVGSRFGPADTSAGAGEAPSWPGLADTDTDLGDKRQADRGWTASRVGVVTGFGEPVWSGRWPELPDDGDQRDLAPGIDAVDGDRIRRLDAEQRGR
jgi:hypothetical protein